jgi:predicted O-methyltransferase YrrM
MGTNEEPWYSRGSIEFLNDNINDSMQVLEYGCGSSTIWLAQRVGGIISIEHSKDWADKVTQLIPSSLRHKINIIHIPNQEQGEHVGSGGRFYDRYTNHIKTLDKTFDIICVDGRCRSQCIINSIDHIKDDGFLLIDNAERQEYHKSISQLPSQWVRMDFPCPVDLTTIFKVVK